jgi:hypothetical protein
MHEAPVMQLLEASDALVCDSLHIDNCDSGFIDNFLQILSKQCHHEASVFLISAFDLRETVAILQLAQDLTLSMDQRIRMLMFVSLNHFNARLLHVEHLVHFPERALANFINNFVALGKTLV